MTPPDPKAVAEAAERYKANAYGDDLDECDEIMRPIQKDDDIELLAAAYVARESARVEVPTDDGEPVTAEWLLSVGFKDEEYSYVLRSPHGDDWYHHLRHTQASVRKQDWKWSANGIGITDQPTRGHVRRLCAALGIQLAGQGVADG